jgi:hypothetical protein
MVHARKDGITKPRQSHGGGRVLVLEEVTDADVPGRSEQLAKPTVVVEVLMGQNHHVDGSVVEL